MGEEDDIDYDAISDQQDGPPDDMCHMCYKVWDRDAYDSTGSGWIVEDLCEWHAEEGED